MKVGKAKSEWKNKRQQEAEKTAEKKERFGHPHGDRQFKAEPPADLQERKSEKHHLKKQILGILKKRGNVGLGALIRKLDAPPDLLFKVVRKLERKGYIELGGRQEHGKHHQDNGFGVEGTLAKKHHHHGAHNHHKLEGSDRDFPQGEETGHFRGKHHHADGAKRKCAKPHHRHSETRPECGKGLKQFKGVRLALAG